jgi:hypothetical protein
MFALYIIKQWADLASESLKLPLWLCSIFVWLLALVLGLVLEEILD